MQAPAHAAGINDIVRPADYPSGTMSQALPAGPAHNPISDDQDTKADARLEAALSTVRSSAPDPASVAFTEALFRRASPEDILSYSADLLAALALLAFQKSAIRKPGESLVDLFTLHAEKAERTSNETVLIAVNDDMPFLFDSLIGLLTARGAKIQALFHPIMAGGAMPTVRAMLPSPHAKA